LRRIGCTNKQTPQQTIVAQKRSNKIITFAHETEEHCFFDAILAEFPADDRVGGACAADDTKPEPDAEVVVGVGVGAVDGRAATDEDVDVVDVAFDVEANLDLDVDEDLVFTFTVTFRTGRDTFFTFAANCKAANASTSGA